MLVCSCTTQNLNLESVRSMFPEILITNSSFGNVKALYNSLSTDKSEFHKIY